MKSLPWTARKRCFLTRLNNYTLKLQKSQLLLLGDCSCIAVGTAHSYGTLMLPLLTDCQT